jgi:hypothetical protein
LLAPLLPAFAAGLPGSARLDILGGGGQVPAD